MIGQQHRLSGFSGTVVLRRTCFVLFTMKSTLPHFYGTLVPQRNEHQQGESYPRVAYVDEGLARQLYEEPRGGQLQAPVVPLAVA